MRKDDHRPEKYPVHGAGQDGQRFSGYKSSISRRVERRMAVNQVDTVDEYARLLQEHPAEIEELVKGFLINVTSFSRDEEAFEALKSEIGLAQGQALRKPGQGLDTGLLDRGGSLLRRHALDRNAPKS